MTSEDSRSESAEQQRARVRERFTRTAEAFATFALAKRSAHAEKLAGLAAPQPQEFALDVATGPGTFLRALAPHVRRIAGVDFTPALLAGAQRMAREAGLTNAAFVRGDAHALPFRDASFDLLACGFSLHHFSDAAAAIGEMARVLRPGGRLALVDIIVPAGAASEINNAIERARDASHQTTFTAEELQTLIARAGLRVTRSEVTAVERSYADWMQIAGWHPGDEAYKATRALLEQNLERDASGFAPRRGATEWAADDLLWQQTSYFLVAAR